MASSVALAIRVLTLDGVAPPQLARALGVILTSGGHSSCAPHAPWVTSILRLAQSTSTGGKESGPAPAKKAGEKHNTKQETRDRSVTSHARPLLALEPWKRFLAHNGGFAVVPESALAPWLEMRRFTSRQGWANLPLLPAPGSLKILLTARKAQPQGQTERNEGASRGMRLPRPAWVPARPTTIRS
jgi:hypothetical protein